MSIQIPITFAVEDELGEHLLRSLINQTGRQYIIADVFGKRGNVYLKTNLRAFNNAAKGHAHLLLTDLDNISCVPQLIQNWFSCPLDRYSKARHHNLLFRVACREVEAWVLADRARFAQFIGVPTESVPRNPDELPDPKKTLLELAGKSRRKGIREDLVRLIDGIMKQGPDYNGRLADFLYNTWQAPDAIKTSPSLRRTWDRLILFHPHTS